MPDLIKNFWQDNLEEIRANKIRFGVIIALFIFAVIVALADNSSGEEISLNEPAPTIPAEKPAENIIPVQNNFPASDNLTAVVGANSSELIVHNPFQKPTPKFIPASEKIPEPEPEPIELPQIFIPPPVPTVAQEPEKTAEKFILRGTAITGNQKSAIINKISSGDTRENFIVNIGDTLGGRRVVEIFADSVILEDGTKISISP